MKYNEEEILKQVIEYIQSTYNQHYSTDGKGLQAMDIFRNMDIDMDFSQANAIKYLMRYGKKQGRNEKDLYKAIHYIVLLLSSERGKQRVTRNEKGTTIGELYNPRHN